MNIPINFVTFFVLKVLRKTYSVLNGLFGKKSSNDNILLFDGYCEFSNQEGNDQILKVLQEYKSGGFMISKWGTTELDQVVATIVKIKGFHLSDIPLFCKRYISSIDEAKTYQNLFFLSGVFPKSQDIAHRFALQALKDCELIDVLGSYIKQEYVLKDVMKPRLTVNLDAFYAPWLFKNPWTQWLRGKRVVVVHPFVESIEYQYNFNRTKLFADSNVLPEFKSLRCIKAVQTIAGQTSSFKDWFDALDYMEREINKEDYDVAIIGCGAYGMSLAAYVKRQGKVAIHLAGWTQMLFGVYGERWVSQQTNYSHIINKYWIRPNKNENVKAGNKVEEGCYW